MNRTLKCDSPPNRRLRAVAFWHALLAISAVILEPLSPSKALPAEVTEAAEAAKPLAECAVKKVGAAETDPEYMVVANRVVMTPDDDPLKDYQPHRPTPGATEPGATTQPDSEVVVAIHAPGGRRTVKLNVTIDGVGFRALRDRWIDGVMGNSATANDESDDGEAEQRDGDSDGASLSEVKKPIGQPVVEVQTRSAPTLRQRLTSYLAALGSDVDREEVHWLLDRWDAGPQLTVLGAGRSWERAGVAPLRDMLDEDNDGVLSAEEIASVGRRLRDADINEDGIIELGELRRRATGSRHRATPRSPLVTVEASDAVADMAFEVHFKSEGDGTASLVALGDPQPGVVASPEEITVDLSGDYLEVSAVQLEAQPKSNEQPEQLSVGAVVDGYPLWRKLDADGDNRLTQREQRALNPLLKEIDRNGDGQISAEETPTAIRLAVGRGPVVHRLLDSPRPAAARSAESSDVTAPDWFLSMDRNSDGELSRDEFAGTREQFAGLDKNGDGLLSAAEAGGGGG